MLRPGVPEKATARLIGKRLEVAGSRVPEDAVRLYVFPLNTSSTLVLVSVVALDRVTSFFVGSMAVMEVRLGTTFPDTNMPILRPSVATVIVRLPLVVLACRVRPKSPVV